MDHSGLEAINTIADRYASFGKKLTLRHLSSDCAQLLSKINEGEEPSFTVDVDPSSDPVYEIAEKPAFYKDIRIPKLG